MLLIIFADSTIIPTMYMNKFNINHNKYDITTHKGDYKITFINPIYNIGKNDIHIFINNNKNKTCRRLIDFKITSICLFKYNK
jgi:hypothetical protein